MRRSESTVRRERQGETKGFLLLLLLIVAVVALIQLLLFLTIKKIGTGGSGFTLPQVERDLRGIQSRSEAT